MRSKALSFLKKAIVALTTTCTTKAWYGGGVVTPLKDAFDLIDLLISGGCVLLGARGQGVLSCFGQVVYFTPNTYPASAAMILCTDDDELSAKLQPINEQFEEEAMLTNVLGVVCATLGVGESRNTEDSLTPPCQCTSGCFQCFTDKPV